MIFTKKNAVIFCLLLLIIFAFLFVACGAPELSENPFRDMKITDVSLTYGADGGKSIPLTEAEKQEIISVLKALEIDPKSGLSETFYGATFRLDLTIAEGDNIAVFFAAPVEGIYLSVNQSGEAEPLWFPMVSENANAFYEYCVAIAASE